MSTILIERYAMVAMRDGVLLATGVYRLEVSSSNLSRFDRNDRPGGEIARGAADRNA